MAAKKTLIESVKEKPLRFGGGIALIILTIAMFFVQIDIKAENGDTKLHIKTQSKH